MECAVDWRIKVSAFVVKMELSQKAKLSIYWSSFGLTLPREVILLIQLGGERSGLQAPGDTPATQPVWPGKGKSGALCLSCCPP